MKLAIYKYNGSNLHMYKEFKHKQIKRKMHNNNKWYQIKATVNKGIQY